jgi:hypothetical protein
LVFLGSTRFGLGPQEGHRGQVGGWKMMGYTVADTLLVPVGGVLQFI